MENSHKGAELKSTGAAKTDPKCSTLVSNPLPSALLPDDTALGAGCSPEMWITRYRRPHPLAWRIVALALIAAATVTASGSGEDGGANPDRGAFVVAGYLPEWRYEGADWDATCAHVTHLILFSMEVTEDAKLTASDRFPHAHLDAIKAASMKHHCELVISIGGNKRTGGFPTVAKDKALTRKLARTLLFFVKQHGLHGVDFNWEYPNGEEEWRGLHRMLKITRRVFDRHRDETGERLTVSTTYYPDGRQEKILADFGAAEHVDMAHAMAYDFGPGGHSTMELAENVIANMERLGLNKSIATLGLPFYGRSKWRSGWRTYEDLASEHPSLGTNGGGDEDPSGEYSFNGLDTIAEKVRLAKTAGLRGVMIWELGQDFHPGDGRSLLGAIAREVWPEGRPKRLVRDEL